MGEDKSSIEYRCENFAKLAAERYAKRRAEHGLDDLPLRSIAEGTHPEMGEHPLYCAKKE
jgi:hypothetical protein